MSLEIKETQQVFKGKFLAVFDTLFLDKEGNERHWEWIKKGDIVLILPITVLGTLVLIKNFRVPLEKYVIELPAGMIDSGEDPALAARRELFEETGYEADELVALPILPHASGNTNTVVHLFIATKCKRTAVRSGDVTEDITVLEMSPAEMLERYLHPEPNTLFNIHAFAAYYLALQLKLIS